MKVIILILLPKVALALPTAKATLLVVDENDIPLEGLDAGLGFSVPKKEANAYSYVCLLY
jgi:hypothetical protein